MFAFSPIVGWAADRRAGRVLVTGGVLLLVAHAVRPLAGGSSWQIFAGLFLLGLGWSCATVAASTVIAVGPRSPHRRAGHLRHGQASPRPRRALAGVIVGALGYPALAAFAASGSDVVVAGRAVRPTA